MSNIKWQSYNTADTPINSTLLNGLVNGAYAISTTPVDNTSTDTSGGLFLYGDCLLNLGSSVTAGSGSPMVQLYVLYAPDGVTFPNPPGTGGAAAGAHMLAATGLVPASGSFQSITFPQIVLRPAKFKLMLFNGTGANFPSSGVTFSLYRYGEQAT